jgi:hypothetical protein
MLMSKSLLLVRVSGFQCREPEEKQHGMFALFCCLHLGNPKHDGDIRSLGSWNRSARLSRNSEEVMLQRKERRRCTGGDADLAVNMFCVTAHGILGDKE